LAAATLYSLDTFAVASFTSAKYFIQLKSTTKVHVTEISLFHNGTDVYLNEYGMAFSVDSLGVFDATITGGNVVLQVTPTYAATTVKVVRMSITA
jgi:3D (Asp-Asp-Asp) domain-containing protein